MTRVAAKESQMVKKTKTGKARLDKYYHLAKEQGYRARSAFKLIQLVQKHDIFSNCHTLLDLCAAPGGWLQVAQKNMPISSTIVGVDLVPINPIRNVITLQADITTQRCRGILKKELPKDGCDVVLHDGAPNVGTSWLHDAYAQNELVLHATKICAEFLKPGGTYITKVFRSQDYTALLWVFQQLFNRVNATKPASSRNVSAEIFVICSDYKAPSKIDPKFFDPRHVFVNTDVPDIQPSERPKKALKELVEDLSKRNRSGYQEGDDYRESCISEFFNENVVPHEFLVSHYKLIFSPENGLAQQILNDTTTTEEVKECLSDLRVLGKTEYAMLLKWRFKLLKKWKKEKEESIIDENRPGLEESSTDEDERESKWQKELFELTAKAQKESLDQKRNLKKKLKKAEERRQRSMGVFDAIEIDDSLFSKKKAELAWAEEDKILEKTGLLNKDPDDSEVEDDENENKEQIEIRDQELDISRLAVDAEVHADLEKLHMNEKKLKKNLKKKKETKRQQVYAEWSKELEHFANNAENQLLKVRTEEAEEQQEEDNISDTENNDISSPINFHIEEYDDQKNDESNKNLSLSRNSDILRQRWFEQKLFQESGILLDSDDEETNDSGPEPIEIDDLPEMPKTEKEKRKEKRKKEKEKEDAKLVSKRLKIGPLGVPIDDDDNNNKNFEIVPIGFSTTPNCNPDEIEEIEKPKTNEDILKVKALGSLMINKRTRIDLIDGAYNRYAFDDDEGVPSWFLEEEEEFARPELPITKELMRQYKMKLKEISKRPIRKATEAISRKKLRLKKRLEKVRKQAESLADSTEHTSVRKAQTIGKLTHKAIKEEKRGKRYIVSRQTGSGSVKSHSEHSKENKNAKVIRVDKRLKKDKRGLRVSAKKIKKRKK